MLPELYELNRVRLDRDLTYRALAAEIGITLARVHILLNNPKARPNARTLHKIRTYLAVHRGAEAVNQ